MTREGKRIGFKRSGVSEKARQPLLSGSREISDSYNVIHTFEAFLELVKGYSTHGTCREACLKESCHK